MQDRETADYAKIIARGRDAYKDLSIVEEVLRSIEDDLLKEFAKTKPSDDLGRKNIWQALQISRKVLEYLLVDINKGKNAMVLVDEIKKVGRKTFIERVMP